MSRSNRAGFTLLEMLITLMAGALLLGCLWSLLGMYSRMFNAGNTKAGSAQLLIGLTQQMTDDLHNAIQDGSMMRSDTQGAVRRFGIFGDAHTLQIDVVATAWPRDTAVPVGAGAAYGPEGPMIPQAHELRTVRYSFVDPATAAQAGSEVRAGLLRREFDFETPYDKTGALAAIAAGTATAPVPPATANGADEPSQDEITALDSLPVDLNDDSVSWLPEVVGLEFQYFDGSSWCGTWNSLQQRALPVAIEVVLTVRIGDKPTKPAADGSTAEPLQPTATDPSLTDAAPAVVPGAVTRRFVIYLPGSSLRYSTGAAALAEDRTPEGATSPGPGRSDPALSLLDATMPGDDLTAQQNLLMTPSGGNDAGARSRFRLGRRMPRQDTEGSAPESPTTCDSWIRLGP